MCNLFCKLCNLFCKLSVDYRSKPEQTTKCWLSVTTSSLTHILPISLTSLCTPLPGSFVPLQTDTLCPCVRKKQPLASAVSPTVLQSDGVCSLLTSVTFTSPLGFQKCLKTHLHKQYHSKWFQTVFLFASLLTPTHPYSLLVTFLLCAHVCLQGCDYIITVPEVLMYIFVGLVMHGVLILVSEMWH